MVKDHPFVDGNKRLAVATTNLFLWKNNVAFLPPDEELLRFTVELAASSPALPWQSVAGWIRFYSVRLDRAAELHHQALDSRFGTEAAAQFQRRLTRHIRVISATTAARRGD